MSVLIELEPRAHDDDGGRCFNTIFFVFRRPLISSALINTYGREVS